MFKKFISRSAILFVFCFSVAATAQKSPCECAVQIQDTGIELSTRALPEAVVSLLIAANQNRMPIAYKSPALIATSSVLMLDTARSLFTLATRSECMGRVAALSSGAAGVLYVAVSALGGMSAHAVYRLQSMGIRSRSVIPVIVVQVILRTQLQ
jgi:hypothetical protein